MNSFIVLFQNVRSELARRAELESELRNVEAEAEKNVGSSNLLDNNNGGPGGQSALHSAMSNLFVLLGFAAFAYIVKYVVKGLKTE